MKLCCSCHKKPKKSHRTNLCKSCLDLKRRKYLKWVKSPEGKAAWRNYFHQPRQQKRIRKWYYLKVYGLTIGQRNRMLREQHGKCYICKKSEKYKYMGRIMRLSVDHNHKTGKLRHLLCRTCNTMVGYLENSNVPLKRYVKYISEE